MTNSGSSPSIITPLSSPPLSRGMKWRPVIGDEADGMVGRTKLDQASRERLLQSSAEILGSGVDPIRKTGAATGLVVGQVQSGKTMSFTTVIALARDNGFPIVVVVAGTKTPLLTQSHERLSKDLDTERDDWPPAWKMQKNIRATDAHDEQMIRQTLANWRNSPDEDDERATLLLTVLKQNQRLNGLTRTLRKFDLTDVPVLIIDDEADQASLNTRINQGLESTTYTRLRELRDAAPCHTYLQYTATPQAPLLINIADTLSPDFVKVLDPGDDYVGGEEFFTPNSHFVHDIPAGDFPPGGGMPNDPPESFLSAMKVFFVGLAASKVRRSMLVHPSRLTVDHRVVIRWVSAAINDWLRALALPAQNADRRELINDFNDAYQELARTAADLPAFDQIVTKLPSALRNTTPIEFNANGRPRTPEIQWKNARGWILVGGQAVDRGFTVDALTVTYMPRGVGVGNADTIQQRARFFGYKRGYLGLCRIYLEQGARTAFEDYVEHEEIMRRELRKLADEGGNLKTWRRRFVLSPDLAPCRRSVISDPIWRARFRRDLRGRAQAVGGWSQQSGVEMNAATRDANSLAIDTFVSRLTFIEDTTTFPSRQPSQRHEYADTVPLRDVIEFLIDYALEEPSDTANFMGMLAGLREELESSPDATAVVYRMRPTVSDAARTVKDGVLDNFQQGPTRRADGSFTYPGDAAFRDEHRLTLQLHRYNIRHTERGPIVAHAAPMIALHVPGGLARTWLVEVQRGQRGRS